jgi:hypothetical protein
MEGVVDGFVVVAILLEDVTVLVEVSVFVIGTR